MFSMETLASLGVEPGTSILKDSLYVFEMYAGKPIMTDFLSHNQLIGKDLLLPFSVRQNLLGWPDECHKFITGVDEQGEIIEEKCNKRGEFLNIVPVYFKSDVLKKYYDMGSKYTIDQDSISCGDLWILCISRNAENLVQVYLDDLAHIPPSEQLHWKSYNVPPSGGVPQYRIQRDLYAEFTESDDV